MHPAAADDECTASMMDAATSERMHAAVFARRCLALWGGSDAGGECLAVGCDITDPAQVESMMEATRQQYGRLDYAFNNAGMMLFAPCVKCLARVLTACTHGGVAGCVMQQRRSNHLPSTVDHAHRPTELACASAASAAGVNNKAAAIHELPLEVRCRLL